MDVIKSMNVFREVARHGNFASAARSLGVSTTSVSRQVIDLEAWLGVNLFQRTTRKVSLTDEGAYYLRECERVLDDIQAIRAKADQGLERPGGTLRVTAPTFLAKECIQRFLPDFLRDNPAVQIELYAVDRFVDLIEEGYDVGLRVGNLADSSLKARGLGSVPLVVIGSEDYLAANGTPARAADLKHHNCIVDTVASFKNRWPFTDGGKRESVSVSGSLSVNSGEIARELAMQGVGLALLPVFFVSNQLKTGELVEVLQGQVDSQVAFYAVYPQSRHISPKVRAFIDYMVERFEPLTRPV